jgi:hypothetical protein
MAHHSTCWGEPCHPVALTHDAVPYDRLADVLHDTVPDEWMSVRASVVLGGAKGRICTVGTACGSVIDADDACLHAAHDAIMALGRCCLVPQNMRWVGIWIDYDLVSGIMIATIAHGGPASARNELDELVRRTPLVHPAIAK